METRRVKETEECGVDKSRWRTVRVTRRNKSRPDSSPDNFPRPECSATVARLFYEVVPTDGQAVSEVSDML